MIGLLWESNHLLHMYRTITDSGQDTGIAQTTGPFSIGRSDRRMYGPGPLGGLGADACLQTIKQPVPGHPRPRLYFADCPLLASVSGRDSMDLISPLVEQAGGHGLSQRRQARTVGSNSGQSPTVWQTDRGRKTPLRSTQYCRSHLTLVDSCEPTSDGARRPDRASLQVL